MRLSGSRRKTRAETLDDVVDDAVVAVVAALAGMFTSMSVVDSCGLIEDFDSSSFSDCCLTETFDILVVCVLRSLIFDVGSRSSTTV